MEVIIIGAGLAGLSAASELDRAHQVTILEARDRIGGRVWTLREPGLLHPVELGPEWLSRDGAVHDLLTRAGARLLSAHGTRWRRHAGRLESLDDLSDVMDEFTSRLQSLKGPDRSVQAALEDCCDGPGLADARNLLLGYVEGFNAADPAATSVEWLITVEANQPADASEVRSLDGAIRAAEQLRAGFSSNIALELNAVVRRVEWRPGSVQVFTEDGRQWSGDALIVTVPVAVLQSGPDQAGGIEFHPELREKRAALDLVATGPVLKLVLEFREPFWRREAPLEDALFFHKFDEPFPTWWTTAPVLAPLLVAWAAGPQVDRLPGGGGDDLVEPALRSLGRILDCPVGELKSQLVRHWFHDWQQDPFARGAYTYMRPGGVHAPAQLAEPVAHTVYLAGEATAVNGYNATMEGAVQSGRRAARMIGAG